VDPSLDLIKGMGGALLREKMVAQATRRMVVIVDEGKVVEKLGTRSPLPVEVTPFGWKSHPPFFRSLGAEARLRCAEDGEPYFTDNGNLLLECTFSEGIPDPGELDRLLASRAGIVESGLFLSLAREALVGGEDGVRVLTRGDSE
jgi:ribose 5-phosphate isomerase A